MSTDSLRVLEGFLAFFSLRRFVSRILSTSEHEKEWRHWLDFQYIELGIGWKLLWNYYNICYYSWYFHRVLCLSVSIVFCDVEKMTHGTITSAPEPNCNCNSGVGVASTNRRLPLLAGNVLRMAHCLASPNECKSIAENAFFLQSLHSRWCYSKC